MIVEFIGVSGVGKSTVAETYYSKALDDGRRIEWPRHRLYMEMGWLKRNLVKSATVLRVLLGNIGWTRKAVRIFAELGIRGKDRLVLLFNYLSYKGLFDQCTDPGCEYLFDEGAFQLIWAAYLRTEVPPSTEVVGDIVDLFQAPACLTVVDAETDIIVKRLRGRGRRTKLLEAADLRSAVQTMKAKQTEIIECAVTSGMIDAKRIEYYDNSPDQPQSIR